MTLRLSDDEAQALRYTADQEGQSMQEVARDAISRYTSGRQRLRDEALARIDTEWRDVFDRLAETRFTSIWTIFSLQHRRRSADHRQSATSGYSNRRWAAHRQRSSKTMRIRHCTSRLQHCCTH